MSVPVIFRWPTPWLWGAIGVLVWLANDGFDVLQGLAVVTIVASGITFLRSRRCEAAQAAAPGGSELESRLDTIERRLTDTQDVMIALSEKVDAWEARTKAESAT